MDTPWIMHYEHTLVINFTRAFRVTSLILEQSCNCASAVMYMDKRICKNNKSTDVMKQTKKKLFAVFMEYIL